MFAVIGGTSGVSTGPARVLATRGIRSASLCILLAIVTIAVYSPVHRSAFINMDDNRYVTENPHLRAGVTWNFVEWAFGNYYLAYWHPVTWISHAIDYQLFQLNAARHHDVNLLLHLLNVILLFFALERVTALPWRSLIVAALFAVHPINVESVAWVAERKNVLSMLFCLLALLVYENYVRNPRVWRYLLVALFFALGLMAKPQIIALPFVLLLWDYWPLRRTSAEICSAGTGAFLQSPPVRTWPQLFLEKVPLLFLSAASAAVTLYAHRAVLVSTAVHPVSLRLENALMSYVRYIAKAFWPFGLAALYPYPKSLFPFWQVTIAALFLLLVTVLVLRHRKRGYLFVGWFWFLGTLVPMLGFIQVGAQAMADRFAYLSFIGLFLMIVWSLADLFQERMRANTRLVVPILCTSVLFALSVMAHRQAGYWRNSVTLWSHTLQVTDDNLLAQLYLAWALAGQGRFEEGMAHVRTAEKIAPNNEFVNLYVGVYEQRHGQVQEAIACYQKVLLATSDPDPRLTAMKNLGSAYHQMGDDTRARESYQRALQLAPDDRDVLIRLGLFAHRSGDFAEAIRDYSRANAVEPTDVGYLLLSHAFQQNGQTAEAQSTYEQAKRISKDFAQAQKLVDTWFSL